MIRGRGIPASVASAAFTVTTAATAASAASAATATGTVTIRPVELDVIGSSRESRECVDSGSVGIESMMLASGGGMSEVLAVEHESIILYRTITTL